MCGTVTGGHVPVICRYSNYLFVFLELRPILNTFRRAIESADTTREEIITDIRTISVVLGAVVVAVLLVAIGVIVCTRSSAAQRSRMNSALMALFHETNARPAAVEPNFRI